MTMAKKTGTKSAAAKSTPKPPSKRARSMPKEGKDPKGGLTAAGRKFYNEQTGGHLKPGVKGVPDTPEKKQRKGSFLTRHFTTPPGPWSRTGSRPGRPSRPQPGENPCRKRKQMKKSWPRRAANCSRKRKTRRPKNSCATIRRVARFTH